MPQTTILGDPLPAFPGQIAYPMRTHHVDSAFVAQAGGIAFGSAVVRVGDQTVKQATTGTDITGGAFRGFAMRQEYNAWGTDLIPDKEECPVLRKGWIWIQVEGAVTKGAPVFVRTAANGGNTTLGIARADADSGNAAQVPNARFDSTTAGAGLAIVEVW